MPPLCEGVMLPCSISSIFCNCVFLDPTKILIRHHDVHALPFTNAYIMWRSICSHLKCEFLLSSRFIFAFCEHVNNSGLYIYPVRAIYFSFAQRSIVWIVGYIPLVVFFLSCREYYSTSNFLSERPFLNYPSNSAMIMNCFISKWTRIVFSLNFFFFCGGIWL